MLTSFLPIALPKAHTLILGSMPSIASLEKKQYYAHPKNAFWSVMETLYAIPKTSDYSNRIHQFQQTGLALWDVIQSCERPTSLDSDIIDTTVIVNNIQEFLQKHSSIHKICFNGKKAEILYKKYVFSTLFPKQKKTLLYTLPSTSPAMAKLSLKEKTEIWKKALFS